MSAFSSCLGIVAVGLGLLFVSPASAQQAASTNQVDSTSALTALVNPAGGAGSTTGASSPAALLDDARTRFKANDYDGALKDLTQLIGVDPKNINAYMLRGSIYSQKKQWSQAEADFNTALQIAPTDNGIKYNIAEIQFRQQHYDVARPQFVALEGIAVVGDIATYKVFLCDLLGGHEDVAAKELDVMNQKAENPSYFFSNAAWSVYHKNVEDARSWLTSAVHIYPPGENNFYAQSLKELGYLPLPPPVAK